MTELHKFRETKLNDLQQMVDERTRKMLNNQKQMVKQAEKQKKL
jgi:hypothetical protein